ncbi:hypothetical protein [Clostridium ragsdalei]|uniref:hypothetical protein n=1 Tax=Clostridium ragsdalei TaxID=217158 RepID=UPI0007EE7F31|nr:hypothetical protein [Clostridium ragsdalei]
MAKLFPFTISFGFNGVAKRFSIVPLVLSLTKGTVVKRGIFTIGGIRASNKRVLFKVSSNVLLS